MNDLKKRNCGVQILYHVFRSSKAVAFIVYLHYNYFKYTDRTACFRSPMRALWIAHLSASKPRTRLWPISLDVNRVPPGIKF